ncbi:hypothetical protein GY45DRAFT_1390159 [Cubamyces sp. BRFM 1775]|nr:hypothetical protein GY45DRAFT_1390159 [Cubamyces sp. BRFM 1775]
MSVLSFKARADDSRLEQYFMIPGAIFDFDGTVPWNLHVEDKCKKYRVPNVLTRPGLNQVHAHFTAIWKRLDREYARAKKANEDVRVGGVVAVMTMMSCMNLSLASRPPTGMLPKITPLVERAITRRLALQSLAIIAEHSDKSALQAISRYNHTLARIMEEYSTHYPDDPMVTEHAIVTTFLAATAVLDISTMPFNALLAEEACIPLVLEATTDALRRPIHSHVVHIHVFRLFYDLAREYAEECKANTSLLKLFAALTRSEDITTRVVGMLALLSLYDPRCESAQADADSPCLPRDIPGSLGTSRASLKTTAS